MAPHGSSVPWVDVNQGKAENAHLTLPSLNGFGGNPLLKNEDLPGPPALDYNPTASSARDRRRTTRGLGKFFRIDWT